MKILFIPSWYPYAELPHAGSFIINQANALAELGGNEISILNYGQLAFQLTIRRPFANLKKLYHYSNCKPNTITWKNGIREYQIPHLNWTHHIYKGNIPGLIPKLHSLPRFDLIHAHVCYPAGYIAMRLSETTHTPYLITEHSGPFPLPGLMKGDKLSPWVSEPLSKAKSVIAVSSTLANDVFAKSGKVCAVIPNLVDTNLYQPLSIPLQDKPFTLFALSSLSVAKGILDLLEAMKIIKQNNIQMILKIGGSGLLSAKLHKEIIDNNMQDKIIMLGQLTPSQAIDYYQKCDCFIMPSHHESFSVVLLEALACGKPVIATACGGPNDIVNDDCGLLVPVNDPNALAEAIIKMKAIYKEYDPVKLSNYCRENYSPALVASKIQKVYTTLLNS